MSFPKPFGALAFLLFSGTAVAQSSRPLILDAAYAAQYNTFTGYIGAALTPNANFSLTALGREYIAGNSGTHTVKLIDAATNLDIPGGSIQITMSGATLGTYQFVTLP